jgi:putative FmdB family regulatory protein
MPLYEYECEVCGTRFEQIQKFSDPPAGKCPACGGTVHKLMSLAAIQFKGSGWYVTDYARKEQSRETKSDTDKGATSSDSAERNTSSPSSTSTSSSSPANVSTGPASSDS